jgi:hypothetical protein
MFLQLIHQSTNALTKIHLMTSVKLQDVSTPGVPNSGIFLEEGSISPTR